MKAPVKYTIFCLLYMAGDDGIWEYDLYQVLKRHYKLNSLTKLREILVEFATKNWTEITQQKLCGEEVIRRYKLQNKHREFLEYQLDPKKLLAEMGIVS